MLPDPAFLYLGKKHQTALTLLEYALYNYAGFCVISGETGAGKTTLLRQLLNNVDDSIVVGMITNTHQSFGTLLDWVLSAFNIHQPNMGKVEMHQLFVDFLLEQYAKNKTTLLIVDEAQNLSVDTLEELRMLSNVNSDKDQVLQVILAGQPALKDTLKKPELMQFAQRIAVDYHLESLSLEETCGYIQHRLKTSGATRDIFTPDACVRIHSYSGGIPRLINLICDTVLVYGFADQNLVIDKDLIDEMVQERMKDSVVPILNVDTIKKIKGSKVKKLDFEFPSIAVTEDSELEEDEEPVIEEKETTEVAMQETVSESAESAEEVVAPEADLEQKMHFLEDEVHELEDEVQDLEDEVHDKDISLYKTAPERRRKPDLLNSRVIFMVVFMLMAGLFVMTIDRSSSIKEEAAADIQSVELKRMLQEVEQAKIEIENMKSKEAERLVEIAKMKSDEIKRKSDLALDKAKGEELRITKEKVKAVQELKIAREKAIRAEKRIDEMFKQRKIEEQKRLNELLAKEREIEQMRATLNKDREKATKKRAAIQATFDEIDSVLNQGSAGRDAEPVSATKKAPRKSKSFVTDPCSSSSARFLSTCR